MPPMLPPMTTARRAPSVGLPFSSSNRLSYSMGSSLFVAARLLPLTLLDLVECTGNARESRASARSLFAEGRAPTGHPGSRDQPRCPAVLLECLSCPLRDSPGECPAFGAGRHYTPGIL